MDLWDFPHTSVAKQTSAELFKILPMTDYPPSYLPTPSSNEFKRRNTVTALQRRPSLSSREIEDTIAHIATNQSEECKKSWYIIQQLVEEVKHRELYNKELEMRNKQLVRQKSATGQTFENMRRQSLSQACKKNHRSTSLAEFVASPRARKYSCLDVNAHVVVPMDLVQEMLTCESDEKHQRKANQEPTHYEGELKQDLYEEEEEEEEELEESNNFGEASCELREQLNNYVFPLKDVGDDETPEQSYYSSCEISVRDYDEADEEADEYPEEAQDEEQAEEEEEEEVYEQDDEEVEQQDARYRSFVDSLNVDDFEPYISDDEES